MKELCDILRMEDQMLGNYLKRELKKMYSKVITDNDNYLYVKGTAPICLVAHIDTVRNKIDSPVTLSISRTRIKNVKGVLGADDRAGVFGILEVVRSLHEGNKPLPSVIFTNYEESGGRGVKEFIKTGKFDPRGIDLLVELDRKGCNEYVFYSSTLPIQVKDYVESHGFKEERGSYSDISDLTDTYEIPSVNLSIGYYNQHTARETLHYDELMLTVDRVINMCTDPIGNLYRVAKPVWKQKYGRYYDGYDEMYGSCYGVRTVQPKQGAAAAHNLTLVKKQLSAEEEIFLEFDDEISCQVLNIVSSRKDEIRDILTSTWSLDTIAQEYISHVYNVQIFDMLEVIQTEFFGNYTLMNSKSLPAFHRTWGETVDRGLIKLAGKLKTAKD